VYGDYAASVGKTAETLTEAEKKQAMVNAVIAEGQQMIQAAGGITMTYAEQIQAAGVAVEELKITLGERLAPAVAAAAGHLTFLIQSLSGELPSALSAAAEGAKATGASFEEMAQAALEAKIGAGWGEDASIFGLIQVADLVKLTGYEFLQLAANAGASADEIMAAATRWALHSVRPTSRPRG
jgi:hypothetical protein